MSEMFDDSTVTSRELMEFRDSCEAPSSHDYDNARLPHEADDAETEPLNWMAAAECKNYPDAKVFFPELGEDNRAAKAICKQCVVKIECDEYALTYPEKFGVWGERSERQRRRIRRQIEREKQQ